MCMYFFYFGGEFSIPIASIAVLSHPISWFAEATRNPNKFLSWKQHAAFPLPSYLVFIRSNTLPPSRS